MVNIKEKLAHIKTMAMATVLTLSSFFHLDL